MSREESEWFENWTVQMRKGVLDLCILKALSAGEWYGYALVKALVAVPELPLPVVAQAALVAAGLWEDAGWQGGFTLWGVSMDQLGIALTRPYDGEPAHRGNGHMAALTMAFSSTHLPSGR